MTSEKRMESANCRFCGQVMAFQVPADSKMTQNELIEEATLRCTCFGAREYRDKLYTLKKGEDAINRIVSGKHEDMKALFKLALKKVIDEKIKKLTLQINDTTTISMWLDKGRVKVQKKFLQVSTSDGTISQEVLEDLKEDETENEED